MNGLLLKIIGIAIALPVVAVWTQADREKRIETYNISTIEQPIMSSCSRKMSGKNVKFKHGASVKNGCACIAKHAASTIKPKLLPTFNKTLNTTLDIAKKTIATNDKAKQLQIMLDAQQEYITIQKAAKMNDYNYTKLFKQTIEFVGICGDRTTHSGESLAKIAAMTPIGQPAAPRKTKPVKTPAAQVVSVKRKKEKDKEVIAQLR